MFICDYKINKSLYQIRDALTSEFLTHLQKYGNKITQNKRLLAKQAVSCFLLNSHKRFLAHKDFCYLSLNDKTFSKGTIINGQKSKRKVSYTYFRSLIDFLDFEDYILLKKGRVVSFNWDNGYAEVDEVESSTAMFKPKLVNLFHKVQDYQIEQRVDVIKLKDSKKNQVTFRMTEMEREVKEYIDGYNKFSLSKVVKVGAKRYDVQIYKVYNNSSFNDGGRSVMSDSIQSLNKNDRRRATIEDYPVCVYDFKGFEPSILYSMEQEVMEMDDPYEIEMKGYDHEILRKITKVGMLIMLNAESEDEASKAFNFAIAKDFNPKKLYEKELIPTDFIHTKIIMQKILEKHHLISHRFYQRFGGQVMYVGSLINDYVLSYMMQNHKQLVIQTHDEFACDYRYEKELKDCMVKAWNHVFGFTDNCRIIKEK